MIELLNLPYKIATHYKVLGYHGLLLLLKRYMKSYKLLSVSLPNYKYPIILRNNTSDVTVFYQVFLSKSYSLKPDLSSKVIIDCGANIGMSSIFFKHIFPNAHIIAVEPELSNFKVLLKNTVHYEDISCLNYGIWNSSVNLKIKDQELGKWGFMVEEVSFQGQGTVPAISIMDIMSKFEINQIDILKIDIEGSERELFEKNYDYWLSKTKILIIELHDGLRAGASKSFFKAMSNYDFSMIRNNENLIFYFTD